jgi:hypothetical protein
MAGCDQLWLRLQWLGFDDWLRAANGFGFNGLVSKPGYELENSFSFNGWLRLQCLDQVWLRDAWLRPKK